MTSVIILMSCFTGNIGILQTKTPSLDRNILEFIATNEYMIYQQSLKGIHGSSFTRKPSF